MVKTKTKTPATADQPVGSGGAKMPRVEGLLSAQNGQAFSMPLQTRDDAVALMVRAEEADDGPLRADLIWTRGTRVKRFDYYERRYYWEELALGPENVRMGRLQNGAPLLFNHWVYGDHDSVLGTVEVAAVDGKQGTATVRFSGRESLAELRQDVRDGIIKKVSHMYRIHAYEVIEDGAEGLPVYRATDWEPLEISLVTIAADDLANVVSTQGRAGGAAIDELFPCTITRAATQEDHSMPQPNPAGNAPASAATPQEPQRTAETPSAVTPPAPAATPTPQDPQRTAETPVRSEAEIRAEARALFQETRKAGEALGLSDEQIRAVQDDDKIKTIEQAKARLVDLRAEAASSESGQQTQRVIIGQDETQTRRDAVVDGLLSRMNPGKYEVTERGKAYRHVRVSDVARECLGWRGERIGFDVNPLDLFERAMSTSDFPNILSALGNKRLRDSYNEVQRTFEPLSRRASHTDFKGINVNMLGESAELDKTPEGGEVKFGSFAEGKEFYRIFTFTKGWAFTREMMINDDLNAFERVITKAGGGAARTENREWWKIITENPKMADGVALFQAGSHKNYNATGKALTVDNVAAAVTAMAKQTGLSGADIQIDAAHLVVPISRHHEALQLFAPVVVTAADRAQLVTEYVSKLKVHGERKIDTGAASDAWYLFADPNQNDTFEHAYLAGAEGVQVTSHTNHKTMSVEQIVFLDFGAKALDHRGVYKQTGANAA